ncbi:MAG: DUF4139 domain-containing protein [Bryobacteraceae bacterium]|nr:DUF4139 domain-containing protein [Bryobacteraceae bacterium]
MKKMAPLTAALVSASLAAELPVREVILYKNGVGYFSRAGELQAGESARLEFRSAEMNDVLKSLTLEDKSGAKVSSVRYDSAEPLNRKLAEYPFLVGEGQSLARFLDQLKGSKVELRYGSETVSGVVVSARNVTGDEKRKEGEQVVILTDSGELRTIDLTAVSSVKFSESRKQEMLREYLAVIDQSRSRDKRGVIIDGATDRPRQLTASYMLPAAVWKSSYRLVFGTADATLEGWAIVDNTTGDDWTNVRLAVVSGRPVSFVSQLFEPRYVARRTADLAENESVAPVVLEGAVATEQAAMAAPAAAPALAGLRAGSMGKSMRQASADLKDEVRERDAFRRNEMYSSVAATAAARDLGELFEYRFETPVTIRKGQSAMLPFVQQKVNTRKLLIYREDFGLNPMSAAEVNNSTGKTLDGGPITVFDSNTYAGEALMETLKTGDKRLITYALDLGARITTAIDSRNDVTREIHIRRGVLTTKSARVESKTYTIHNVDQRAKTLVIEHPLRPEFKLLNQKPVETTSTHHRFEVKVAPGVTDKFVVNEELVFETSTGVTNLTPDVLASYVQNKALPAQGRLQLEQLLAKKREAAALDSQIRQADASLNELTRDQERVRQNIYSLNNVAGQQQQVQKYSAQLAAAETRIAQLRDSLADLRARKGAVDGEIAAMVEKLEF